MVFAELLWFWPRFAALVAVFFETKPARRLVPWSDLIHRLNDRLILQGDNILGGLVLMCFVSHGLPF